MGAITDNITNNAPALVEVAQTDSLQISISSCLMDKDLNEQLNSQEYSHSAEQYIRSLQQSTINKQSFTTLFLLTILIIKLS